MKGRTWRIRLGEAELHSDWVAVPATAYVAANMAAWVAAGAAPTSHSIHSRPQKKQKKEKKRKKTFSWFWRKTLRHTNLIYMTDNYKQDLLLYFIYLFILFFGRHSFFFFFFWAFTCKFEAQLCNPQILFLVLQQGSTAARAERQDVDDKHCRSVSAGPCGLCRGQEAEQLRHHAGWQQCQPGIQVWIILLWCGCAKLAADCIVR